MRCLLICITFCIGLNIAGIAQKFSLSTAPKTSFQNTDKEWQYKPGAPTNKFKANPTVELYLLLKVDAWAPWEKMGHRIKVDVRKIGAENEFIWEQSFNLNGKAVNTTAGLEVTLSESGDYIARVYDEDDESNIRATAKFTVTQSENTSSLLSEGIGNGSLVFCDYVNDDWKAVKPVTKIHAGECINFFLTMKKNIPELDHLSWQAYKIKADGTDDYYVDEVIQTVQNTNVKYVATEDKVCLFSEKGRYRIYAQSWIGTSNHPGNLKDYYAKAELTVD